MRAAGRTATISSHTIQPGTIWAEERLPWMLAMPLIGGISLGLWLAIWRLTRLALAG